MIAKSLGRDVLASSRTLDDRVRRHHETREEREGDDSGGIASDHRWRRRRWLETTDGARSTTRADSGVVRECDQKEHVKLRGTRPLGEETVTGRTSSADQTSRRT
jgi:hypothetical protein